MTNILVIPVGDPEGTRYAIEKVDGGRVFQLLTTNMMRHQRRVIINDRESAEAIVEMLEEHEESMFRNRPWFWNEIETAYQGGYGVSRMQGASA